jgi:hypothetical protein
MTRRYRASIARKHAVQAFLSLARCHHADAPKKRLYGLTARAQRGLFSLTGTPVTWFSLRLKEFQL